MSEKKGSKKLSDNRRRSTKKTVKRGKHKRKLSSKQKKLIVLMSILGSLFVVGFVGVKATQFLGGVFANFNLFNSKDISEETDSVHQNSGEQNEQYDIQDENEEAEAVKAKHNVFIDAGCGGYEKGYSPSSDVVEKNINLTIAKKVAQYLSNEEDINVIMSRQEDLYVSEKERKALATSEKAEVFVSIHMAGESTGTATGAETIYHADSKDGSYDLASIVQTSISAYVDTNSRGINPYSISLLESNTMPSIYVQCGFLSNKDDLKKLTNDKYQDSLAEGISQGILTYIDAKE